MILATGLFDVLDTAVDKGPELISLGLLVWARRKIKDIDNAVNGTGAGEKHEGELTLTEKTTIIAAESKASRERDEKADAAAADD